MGVSVGDGRFCIFGRGRKVPKLCETGRAAIQALISDSSQPTARAPIDRGLGKVPAATSPYRRARDRPVRRWTSGSRSRVSGWGVGGGVGFNGNAPRSDEQRGAVYDAAGGGRKPFPGSGKMRNSLPAGVADALIDGLLAHLHDAQGGAQTHQQS